MAILHEWLWKPAKKLISLEEDYLVNGNTEVSDGLKSTRSEFQTLMSEIRDDVVKDAALSQPYKLWFQERFDALLQKAEELHEAIVKGLPPEKWFKNRCNWFWTAFDALDHELSFNLCPDREELRRQFVCGRGFPQSEFVRELLRAFGPLDRDEEFDAAADRLHPYYPMPTDVSEAIRSHGNKERPTQHDWCLLLFALAEQFALPLRKETRLSPAFDSGPYFNWFVTAIASAGTVTPGFTGPSLRDKLDGLSGREAFKAISEIGSWAANHLSIAESASDTANKSKTSKRMQLRPDKTKDEWLKTALRTHHKCGSENFNFEAATLSELSDLTHGAVSNSTISRRMGDWFDGYTKYKIACVDGTIRPRLDLMNGDIRPEGMLKLVKDVEDEDKE
jgi:hypothetical protein